MAPWLHKLLIPSSLPRDVLDKRTLPALYFTWALTAAMGCTAVLWIALSEFAFPPMTFLYLLVLTAGMQVMAFTVKALKLHDGDMAFMLLQQLLLVMLGTIFGELLLYLGTALAFPLTDEQLIAIDRMFGFDWLAYIAWLSQYPALATILKISYVSMLPQTVFVMWLFALTRRIPDMERFVIASFITLIITIAVASLWPALGGYVFHDVSAADYGLYPAAERKHEADLLALRSQELKHFPFIMAGLVTFPSFHATMAILLWWAAWPLKYWRWPGVALNVLMVWSVLADGGHYLIDAVGGIVIALIGMRLTYLVLPHERKDNAQTS